MRLLVFAAVGLESMVALVPLLACDCTLTPEPLTQAEPTQANREIAIGIEDA
jgi:hypothetical protein